MDLLCLSTKLIHYPPPYAEMTSGYRRRHALPGTSSHPLSCPVHALPPHPVHRSGQSPPIHKTLPVRKPLVSTREGAKMARKTARFFPFYFEKNYDILSRTKTPFYRYSYPQKVTVVPWSVDRTTSCTDGSQCRSTRLLAISNCSTKPLAQPGVWFQVRAPVTRSVAGAQCRRPHPLWHEQGPVERAYSPCSTLSLILYAAAGRDA